MSNKGIEKSTAPAAGATAGTRHYTITVNNQTYNVTVAVADGAQAPAAGSPAGGMTVAPAVAAPVKEGTDVDAPTPGNIIKILVEVGENVVVNQPLVVMEAMKMESEVNAPCAGKISAIHVAAGDAVQASEPLLTIG
ncbi:biotin carboxyl carrier protein [Desulfoprunum benzoelyticum]|uniref:Biotin carboxyl carrier protein n=1 Tax=Desulfoprunum benzoelyticum TaxID=1506996 RepID=A0A840V224_9BACT|nr:biotin carboxyl carrier protein [Desulfoprunum benzoelyticum]